MRRALLATSLALLPVAAAVLAAPALAQRPTAARARTPNVRCTVDTSADWFRKQRAWSDESRHDWSNDGLRVALLHAAGIGGVADAGALPGFEIVGEGGPTGGDATAQASMLDSLRALAKNRQSPWPVRSVVGPAGVRAVWLLAARDSILARTVLHRMMEAGPDESPPAAVATLEDRLRLQQGRKQIYGTQLIRTANGGLEPAPMEDPGRVDLRRDAAGLPPIALALCAARASRSP
ncbi:MAG: hypothetical protein IT359_05260 [Gemmatimonadaceae bacterium]|nr:hypothetical protein [Gemmatimonadaceae bacterium]